MAISLQSRLSLVPVIFLPLILSGCLTMESVETRVVFGDNSSVPAQVTQTYSDISCDGTKPKEIQSNFDELVKQWKEDDYLLDQMEDQALYVKDRKVTLEKGKITAVVTGVSKSRLELEDFIYQGKEHMALDLDLASGMSLEATNGKVVRRKGERVKVVWRRSAKEIYWKIKYPWIDEFEKNRAEMIRLLNEYVKNDNKDFGAIIVDCFERIKQRYGQ